MAQPGYKFSRARFDSVLTIPVGITRLRNINGGRDTGQIRYVTSDSSLYVYTGKTWVKVNGSGGGGGTTDTTSLSNRINLKLNIADTANKWVGNIIVINDSTIRVYEGSSFTDLQILGKANSVANDTTKIPLSGTVVGKPITGDLVLDNLGGNKRIKGNASSSYIEFTDDGGININETTGSNVNVMGIYFNAQNGAGSDGISGVKNYSANYSSLNYIQKVYSDSITNLKLNKSDTAAMLSPYSRVSVSSYGKNAGGDSTILLLSNGTRYAALDSVGGGGASDWSLTGNAGTNASTNFIGTTDNVDFVIKRNNIIGLRLFSSSNVQLATNAIPSLTGTRNLYFGSANTNTFYDHRTTTGSNNISFLSGAFTNTTGSHNISIGQSANVNTQITNTTGSNNIGIGQGAGTSWITSGSKNISIGDYANENLYLGGSKNIAIGSFANRQWPGGYAANGTQGSRNIIIGDSINLPVGNSSNQLNIGNMIYGNGLNGYQETVSTGNIGIGVKIPAQKLEVDGNIKLTGLAFENTDTLATKAYARSVGGGGGGGVTSLSAIGATPNANGATITGSVLNLEPASATFGGVLTTGTQSIAGIKTFSSDVNVNGTLGVQSLVRVFNDGGIGTIEFTEEEGLGTGSISKNSLTLTNTAGGSGSIISNNVTGTKFYEMPNNDGTLALRSDTATLSNRINLKQNLVTLSTTGTSGAATFNQSAGALNIPSYATVSSYGKNATNDSTILLLSNGTRFAAKDSIGSVGAFIPLSGTIDAAPLTGRIRTTNDYGIWKQWGANDSYANKILTTGVIDGFNNVPSAGATEDYMSAVYVGEVTGVSGEEIAYSRLKSTATDFDGTDTTAMIYAVAKARGGITSKVIVNAGQGLEGAADYSGSYGANSFVQKGYVDTKDNLKANLASPTFTGTVTLPAGQVVNGVTLTTAGGTDNFLRADGTYSTPNGTRGLINIRFLTSGTTYTPTAGTTRAVIHLLGGGGGGGGTTGINSGSGAGAGGGAGGYVIEHLTGVTGTYAYTIGAAGTAGAATSGTGGTGGATTFVNGGTTFTASGGVGGLGAAAVTTATATVPVQGGLGGAASNGDVNASGEGGAIGMHFTAATSVSGKGGTSELGAGGRQLISTTSQAGTAGAGFGAGGGGGVSSGNTNAAGGAGSAGIIIIYEYR